MSRKCLKTQSFPSESLKTLLTQPCLDLFRALFGPSSLNPTLLGSQSPLKSLKTPLDSTLFGSLQTAM